MAEASTAVTELYLNSPTPEYSQAFDLAANLLESTSGPALVWASTDAHAIEFLKRCRRHLYFAGEGNFDPETFVNAARPWAWGPIDAIRMDDTKLRFAVAAWAEPESATAVQFTGQLMTLMLTGARLQVISTSWMRRFLPAWQLWAAPAKQPLAPGQVIRLLRTQDWIVENISTYHGPRSVAWGWLNRAADLIGRPDWGERCRLTMWNQYQDPGWLWPVAPLALIHARKPQT